MKGNFIFEVQKAGVTLDWDVDYKKVESAFRSASPNYVVMYKIDRATATKTVIGRR